MHKISFPTSLSSRKRKGDELYTDRDEDDILSSIHGYFIENGLTDAAKVLQEEISSLGMKNDGPVEDLRTVFRVYKGRKQQKYTDRLNTEIEIKGDTQMLFAPSGSGDISNPNQAHVYESPSHEVLNSIFGGLACMSVPKSQSKHAIMESLSAFERFLESTGEAYMKGAFVTFCSDSLKDYFLFPEYGCVILIHENLGASTEPMYHLHMLGLDHWEFSMHGSYSQLLFASISSDWKDIYLGAVPKRELEKFSDFFTKLLHIAQQSKGIARSAFRNKIGHQKTPSFIRAIIKDARENFLQQFDDMRKIEDCLVTKPEGAFTDVGLHTGGAERDTVWPLARAIISSFINQHCLDMNGCISNELEGDFLLWLVRGWMKAFPAHPDHFHIDTAMEMLTSVGVIGLKLVGLGVDATRLEEKMTNMRHELDKWVDQRCSAAAGEFTLPCTSFYISERESCRSPVISIPPIDDFKMVLPNLNETRERASKNLNIVTQLGENSGFNSCQEVNKWLQTIYAVDHVQAQLLLQSIEIWIFNMSHSLETTSQDILTIKDVAYLEAIVEKYRTAVHKFLSEGHSEGRMTVELLSKETLVVWVAYCLIDKTVRTEHKSVMSGFGVSLCFEDLQHLVLADRRALDTLLRVSKYLSITKGPPVFSLRYNDATNRLAEAFSRKSEDIMSTWGSVKKATEKRKKIHLDEILQKKELHAKLTLELADLEQKYTSSKRLVEEAKGQYSNELIVTNVSAMSVANDEMQTTKNSIDLKNDSIAKCRRAPGGVIQPLPAAEDKALCVLFFLKMPPFFQTLSSMSFMAQQMLLPRYPYNETLSITAEKFQFEWVDHYNRCNSSFYVSAQKRGKVLAGSRKSIPDLGDKSLFPTDIFEYDNESTGVWHPDYLPELGWKGGPLQSDIKFGSVYGECQLFDPFMAIDGLTRIRFYTARGPVQSLQWAFYQMPNPLPERGNVAIADPDARPVSMSKAQYITFCNMRAYPHVQIRKLCKVLEERSLQFADPSVQLLVQQLLYQTGELVRGPSGEIVPVWKTDLDPTRGDALQALYSSLLVLTDELAERPRDHEQLPLLIDVITYIRHLLPAVELVRRQCLTVAINWANQMNLKIDAALQERGLGVNRLKADRTVFYMYGVLTYAGTWELSPDDVRQLIELKVLAFNGYAYQSHAADVKKFKALKILCQNVMSGRVETVLNAIEQDRNILHGPAAKVFSACELFGFRWENVTSHGSDKKTACYELVTPDQHLYSINVLTGAVLYDGNPPQSLPRAIFEHRLYKRVFGDIDFEVSKDDIGKLTSTRPLAGFTYSFYLNDTRLTVLEIDEGLKGLADKRGELELMDSAGDWSKELPERLRVLHSHWVNRFSGEVVFRPVHFLNREISFLAVREELDGPYSVYRIPTHLQFEKQQIASSWCHLRDKVGTPLLTDVLVHWASESLPMIVKILSKFETKIKFMHTFRCLKSGNLKIELPRYSLEFEVQAGFSSDDVIEVTANSFSKSRLAAKQQLNDTLPGFSQYLILEHKAKGTRKLIVPTGIVTIDNSTNRHLVFIACDNKCNSRIGHRIYDEHHRFRDFRCSDIASRLQLAALYTATESFYPDPRVSMTGGEFAMELIRRCYVDRPLTSDEDKQLTSVAALAWRTPAVYLLAVDLKRSSTQLEFLHMTSLETAATDEKLMSTTISYEVKRKSQPCNPRTLLTDEEERRILGKVTRRQGPGQPFVKVVCACAELDRLSTDRSFLKEMEHDMRTMAQSKPNHSITKLFVSADRAESILEREMVEELTESYAMYAGMESFSLRDEYREMSSIKVKFQTMLNSVTKRRGETESILLEAVSNFEPCTSLDRSNTTMNHIVSRRLLVAANKVLRTTTSDLVRVLWQPKLLNEINPFLDANLSLADKKKMRSGIVLWMELCVLEDKLRRLLVVLSDVSSGITSGGQVDLAFHSIVVKELLAVRVWDPSQYPKWIALEVDGDLQIRPVQFILAKVLIDHPGSIMQLNMGEGKTRVILPMLILHWTMKEQPENIERPIVRVNMLSQLLGEGLEYLHTILCGSILNCKLSYIPFNRNVELSEMRLQVLISHAEFCQREGLAVFVPPESKCSQQLKWHELRGEGNSALCSLIKRYETLPWKDVIDESDEALKHKFQLIYAVGAEETLPSLEQRVTAAQLILKTLMLCSKTNGSIGFQLQNISSSHFRLCAFLAQPKIAIQVKGPSADSFYADFRLLSSGPAQSSPSDFGQCLTEALLDNLPYELSWMEKFCQSADNRMRVIQLITDVSRPASVILPCDAFEELRWYDVLLSLRGFIGYGVLEHCLGQNQRHRVSYGVAREEERKKLAVPFVACDVPSARSEFAHPDCALMFTTLAYLYDGLNEFQVKETFTRLFSLGESAQHYHYNMWFEASRVAMCEEDRHKINSVYKLDLTDVFQAKVLYKAFKRNMLVIFFWLCYCMLEQETRQYPARLKASAFHVASHPDTGNAPVGFSGTKDNYRLLPSQVKQYKHADVVDNEVKRMLSTDGRMVHLLTHANVVEYCKLSPPPSFTSKSSQSNFGNWKQMILFSIIREASVLIDAGALLAGVSVEDAAIYVLKCINERQCVGNFPVFRAVVYFEGIWKVRDFEGRVSALKTSPVQEEEAFVIFDEHHCRGADMKLRRNAIAVLTLGPKMCKDKLMQAAGRMRLLGSGQRLVLVAQDEVHDAIFQCNVTALSSEGFKENEVNYVLRWIMTNTLQASMSGLLEWSNNGIHFAETTDNPDKARIPEATALADMYSNAIEEECVMVAVESKLNTKFTSRKELSNSMNGVIERIEQSSKEYGREIRVSVSTMGEECERERELEQEEEEEKEAEVPKQKPRQELSWEFSLVLTDSFAAVKQAASAISLQEAIRRHLTPISLNSIQWNDDNQCDIYLTKNFIQTVEVDFVHNLNSVLRAIDTLLVWQDGNMMLLSEREADGVIKDMWRSSNHTTVFVVQHHVLRKYFIPRTDNGAQPTAHLMLPYDPSSYSFLRFQNVKLPSVARLLLFNGETNFGGDKNSLFPILKAMLPCTHARDSALQFTTMRGTTHMRECSDLERACGSEGK